MDVLEKIFLGCWNTLLAMAPFLMFGFFFAGLLSIIVSEDTVKKHLGSGRFLPSLKAALFGIPLPLCSCGVIPVAASLRRGGASRGATTSFLLATPQTGVDSMLVTYSLLGLTFAVFAPIAALVSGVIAGLAVTLFTRDHDGHTDPGADEEDCACCGHEKRSAVYRIFHHGYVVLARDIAVPLLLGLLIAGVISALIPPDFFAGKLGAGFEAKIVMMLVGIPLYVCATASIPIAASLILSGISPGAALVFLMSGPATNAATITTIWKVMGKKTTAIYLATVAIVSLVAGTILDHVYTIQGGHAATPHHDMLPVELRVALALTLLGVLLSARFRRSKKQTVKQG